ncbi:MAG: AmmeMemoRadiSam system protein B [Syntrophobacteraceae bacterium]
MKAKLSRTVRPRLSRASLCFIFASFVLIPFNLSYFIASCGMRLNRLAEQTACAVEAPAASEEIREPVLAGSWYPGDPKALKEMVEGFVSRAAQNEVPGRLTALVAPHAGYVFSGQVAAYAYKILQKREFQTVVVIAPSHQAAFSGVSVYDRGGFRTPLGVVPLDSAFISALEKRESRIRFIPNAHAKEHAIEIQLPFLQTVLQEFKLVPLIMGDQDISTCRWLAEALADCIKDKSVLVVASSDLSHFHSYDQAKVLDQVVIDRINALDPEGLSENLLKGKCEACGGGPMVAAMLLAGKQGTTAGKVLNYANSGDVTGDRNRVVGYLAAAFWTAHQSESKTPATVAPLKVGVDLGLTKEEKAFLHKVVRETVEAGCRGAKLPRFELSTPTLKDLRGAFVTIHKRKELRGCIGNIIGSRPLVETIAEMASAAAFHDPRFPAVTAEELPELEYEISVLTPLRRTEDVSEIQVGIHGIYIKKDGRSGLLLPQVATEYGWDRTAFLENTCEKARLPKDAWKDKSADIYIFSADVF